MALIINVPNVAAVGGWPGTPSGGVERHSNTGSTVVFGPAAATLPGQILDAYTGYPGTGAFGDPGGGRWQLWTGPNSSQTGGAILADTGLKTGNFGATHYGGTVPAGHFYAWFGYRDNIWYAEAYLDVTGGTQALTVPLVDAGSTLYAPTLGYLQAVTVPVLDAGAALYAPVTILASAARVTQVATEVLLTSTDGVARVTQVAVEVLRLTNAQGGSQVIIVG